MRVSSARQEDEVVPPVLAAAGVPQADLRPATRTATSGAGRAPCGSMSGMTLVRRRARDVVLDRDGTRYTLPVATVAELLHLSCAELRTLCESDLPPAGVDSAAMLAPIDGRTEVWASGVTYLRSRSARMDESATPDIYDRVYTADRPELFFKSAAWRVVASGEAIGVREDSTWNVPEPELALVANRTGEIVGFGVCNDVSSRSIEGENPLYLPQAKVYDGACALAGGFRPAWEVDPTALDIRLRIYRNGAAIFDDRTNTSQLVRSLDELVGYLFRAQTFPDGVWLSTGTGLVPPDDVSLTEGDEVVIDVDHIGALRNVVHVVRGGRVGRVGRAGRVGGVGRSA
jgi:2-dehydro-3-deoxy-D-arabinonate dehydratase